MALLNRQLPFRGLQDLEDEFEDLLSRVKGGNGESTSLSAWTPKVDIFEQGDEVIIESELPGIDREDIDVSLEDNQLTIEGERTVEQEQEDRNYYRSERVYDSFRRSFSLPRNIDREQVQATYEDGVLRVSLPVTEESKAKRVAIE
ncbi:MAG: Hsp20/alpha crystallin family protein [bacterium]